MIRYCKRYLIKREYKIIRVINKLNYNDKYGAVNGWQNKESD